MVPMDPRFQLVRMESVRMMVAKATAQRQEICSALVDATTHLLVMLSPLLDSDRARLVTDPFGPRPEHPDHALKREEAPARARDLPASPNMSTCATTTTRARVKSRAQSSPQEAMLPRGLGTNGRKHIRYGIPDYWVRWGKLWVAMGWRRGTVGSQESNLRSQGKNPGGVARQPGRLCGRSRMICEALHVSYAIPEAGAASPSTVTFLLRHCGTGIYF